MARWQGTTTERGYGHPHQAERQRRLALYKPGDICAHGGEVMRYPPPRTVTDRYGTRLVSPHLDLPHTADRSGYLPGLSCRKHNRADGAIRKNRRGRRNLALAKPGEARPCQYCGRMAAPGPRADACRTPLCQTASAQAARMASTGPLTIDQARQQMARRVLAAMERRTA